MKKCILLGVLLLSLTTVFTQIDSQDLSTLIISGSMVNRDIAIETVHPNYESEIKKVDIDDS